VHSRTTRSGAASRALVMGTLVRRPREAMAGLAGFAAVGTIFVNALFLQPGPHPAPIFAARPAALPLNRNAEQAPVRQVGTVPIRSAATFEPVAYSQVPTPAAKPEPAVHGDPIGDLINGSKRLAGVQRALSDFGYGQIKPNGQFGPETEQAIAKFEQQHKMPVTGQMSDRLVKALVAMTGRPVD